MIAIVKEDNALGFIVSSEYILEDKEFFLVESIPQTPQEHWVIDWNKKEISVIDYIHPDLETFNEKQIDTLTKVFVEGNKTQPIRIGQLQKAWNSGDFDKAIALWNYLAPSFVEVVTAQEIADFQSDLVAHNIPLTLDSTSLTLALK